MKVAAVLAAVAAFLPGGRAASAALTARVDVFPGQPRAGQVVTIQLRPFWPLTDGTSPPAVVPSSFPWRVAAISPAGRQVRVRVGRNPDNPSLWSGVMRFRSPGLWTVCVLNFSFTGRACVARSPGWQRLRVRPRTAARDIVDPVYTGPLLIRGLRLDGPSEVRFDGGKLPALAIKISPAPSPRSRPSYTRVRSPGCYAYQVDGLGFTSVIVFEARAA